MVIGSSSVASDSYVASRAELPPASCRRGRGLLLPRSATDRSRSELGAAFRRRERCRSAGRTRSLLEPLTDDPLGRRCPLGEWGGGWTDGRDGGGDVRAGGFVCRAACVMHAR